MMTETQAEYTKSGGDKAKVWDTIQKEVLVRGRGGEGDRLSTVHNGEGFGAECTHKPNTLLVIHRE